eukprot:2199221-Rhodomonas_salina.1
MLAWEAAGQEHHAVRPARRQPRHRLLHPLAVLHLHKVVAAHPDPAARCGIPATGVPGAFPHNEDARTGRRPVQRLGVTGLHGHF